jgi:hypothetical protein
MTKCPHCDGKGETIKPTLGRSLDGSLYTTMDIVECSYCMGTGENKGD